MQFIETPIHEAWLVEPEPHEDERGTFARVWCREEFSERGLSTELAQCSISRNPRMGTLRGLHLQRAPHEESKLVRAVAGAIFDVIVDLRLDSATSGRWFGIRLDAEDGRALYIPEGVAHGFQTLADHSDVLYMISTPYAPEAASGVRWDDPAFAIEWPSFPARIISERDRSWPEWTP